MQYCGSLYGSQLWPLWHSNMDLFYAQWRKALRTTWSLPYRSHCILLPLITDTMPIEVSMFQRVFNFYNKAIKSPNKIVSYIARNCRFVQSSAMGNNLKYMEYKCNLQSGNLIDLSVLEFKKICLNKWCENVNENDYQVSSIIKDVIHMKEGYYPKFFSDEDCEFLIYRLSTE